MIHAHDLQNLLLRGPRTRPAKEHDKTLVPVPVVVEMRINGRYERFPVSAARVADGAYVLRADYRADDVLLQMAIEAFRGREGELTTFISALAERVAGQAEALGQVAEKRLRIVDKGPPNQGDA